VATCHGWAANRSSDIDLQDSIAYQLCDKVLTYSRHWADRLSADLAVKNPLVISMGLNLERYPSSPTKGLFSDAPIKMVTVCELIPRKGVDILLNAMPAVWEHRPALELHIMGGGESEAELRSLAARFDPGAKRIIFHGTVPYPYGSLPDYDLFVLASRSDNLPVILLEAMLAKVPVVATSVGGVPELLAAAACGAIVAPENPRSLADGILGMLQQGRAHLAKLGKKGERFCRAHSDVKKTAWQLDRIYRDTLRHRRGSRSFRK
jgi:glycosyltransferase involved in cell wall biosynthesis